MNLLRLALIFSLGLGLARAAPPPEPFTGNAPIKIIRDELPVFPVVAHAYGLRRGEARIAIAVDEKGQLRDTLVVGYTHRSFADVSLSALRQWRFEPMWVHGVPRGSVAILKFEFQTTGAVVNLDMIRDEMTETYFAGTPAGATGYSVCLPRDLDRIPAPIRMVQPVYPAGLGARPHQGRVTVRFYIDEQGRVRLPRIGSEAHEPNDEVAAWALADATVAAVAQWRFEPPLSNGKPTVVLVEQDFDFLPPP
jgi:TonB family protein